MNIKKISLLKESTQKQSFKSNQHQLNNNLLKQNNIPSTIWAGFTCINRSGLNVHKTFLTRTKKLWKTFSFPLFEFWLHHKKWSDLLMQLRLQNAHMTEYARDRSWLMTGHTPVLAYNKMTKYASGQLLFYTYYCCMWHGQIVF